MHDRLATAAAAPAHGEVPNRLFADLRLTLLKRPGRTDSFADALTRITQIAAAGPLIDYHHRRSTLADYRIPARDLPRLGIRLGPRGYVQHMAASAFVWAVATQSEMCRTPILRTPSGPLMRPWPGTLWVRDFQVSMPVPAIQRLTRYAERLASAVDGQDPLAASVIGSAS
ncbi:hypothetical protein ACFCWG_39505 [Streptomyces sp. NPDC056390]|uniref:hypothetical protein n=1 Tax=Streptomyces sp. NPDC056390 TaxID=3345806 RepID=UPI0035E3ACA4